MKNIVLNTDSKILNDIFNYVLEKHEAGDLNIKTFKLHAKEYYRINSATFDIKSEINLLSNFNFINNKNYYSENIRSISNFNNLKLILSLFSIELKNYINNNGEDREYVDFGKLQRKASPSIESYEYVGNNNTNFIPSERSYGLLFE